MNSILQAILKSLNARVFNSIKSTILGAVLVSFALKMGFENSYGYLLLVLGIILVLGKHQWLEKWFDKGKS